MRNSNQYQTRIEQLNRIGIALSTERDTDRLLEKILENAQELTHADGGTLYLVNNDELRFVIMHTRSLGIYKRASSSTPSLLKPIALYDANGQANTRTVASYVATSGNSVNIADIRQTSDFDFSGTLDYDGKTGYHSHSFLTIPMRNHEDDVVGILQLINARDPGTNQLTQFSEEDQQLVESLASQAAVALTNSTLLNELKQLLEKFIEVIAQAIDDKSPYTGGHCRRVPIIAQMFAEDINSHNEGPLAECCFSETDLYELNIAALLHDCGKITTPVHVVDKATKLETIFDRIELLEARFEILKRDAEIWHLNSKLAQADNKSASNAFDEALQQRIDELNEQFEFLKTHNSGGEFMADKHQQRVHEIASQRWQTQSGESRPLLTDEEVYNLTIQKGTLNQEERAVINGHISSTIKMLEALPFPKHLRNVPEIAGGHHERMDGKGYPRGLTREQMSIQARMMGITDIFEALTAADRPYKKAMPLSVALNIMGRMSLEGHIDPDLFNVFIKRKTYLRYARKHLAAAQIDDVDITSLPGFIE